MAEEMTSEQKQDLDLEMLNAELTPDERLVAQEDAEAAAENRPSEFSLDDSGEGPLFDPIVDPLANGEALPGDVIPDDIIRRAKDFNFTDDAIHQMHQQGSLASVLGNMDRALLTKLSSQRAPETLETNKVTPEAEPVTSEEYELEFDKYMDPSIRGNFEKLLKQNQDLKQKHQALVDFQQGKMQSDQLTQFDDMVSKLGEEFHPMLGASFEERSQRGSPAYESAGKLWEVFNSLKGISKGLTDEDVFRRAVSAEYPDHRVRLAESAVKRDVSDRLRDARSGRFVTSARPSKRSESLQVPGGEDHEAQEFIDQFLAEKGIRTQPASNLDDMLNG